MEIKRSGSQPSGKGPADADGLAGDPEEGAGHEAERTYEYTPCLNS